MIKIIKDGKIPKKQKAIYTIQCHHCGCVFECESSDFLYIARGLDCTFEVTCPCCGAVIKNNADMVKPRYEDIE